MLLEALEHEEQLELLRAVHHGQTAITSNGGIRPEDFKRSQQQAKATLDDIWHHVRPWDAAERQARAAAEHAEMLADYTSEYGDPRDPEVLERLMRAADASRTRQTTEDPEVTLAKRVAAREQRTGANSGTNRRTQ